MGANTANGFQLKSHLGLIQDAAAETTAATSRALNFPSPPPPPPPLRFGLQAAAWLPDFIAGAGPAAVAAGSAQRENVSELHSFSASELNSALYAHCEHSTREQGM